MHLKSHIFLADFCHFVVSLLKFLEGLVLFLSMIFEFSLLIGTKIIAIDLEKKFINLFTILLYNYFFTDRIHNANDFYILMIYLILDQKIPYISIGNE